MDMNMIESRATKEQITEARDWIADAYPQSGYDMSDVHPVYDLSAERVEGFITRRYPGGWVAFVEECCTVVQITTDRIDRLTADPWRAEVSDIIAVAARKNVVLTPGDIKGQPGDYTIDGMEWWAWLDAMTQD